jgi:hypothetical protein
MPVTKPGCYNSNASPAGAGLKRVINDKVIVFICKNDGLLTCFEVNIYPCPCHDDGDDSNDDQAHQTIVSRE